MSPEEVAAAPTVVRWFDSAKLHRDPEDEKQLRLRLLGDFCAHMGQSPDELAGGLRRTTKGGKAVAPSIASRTMSAWPAWRAVSEIRWRSTQRTDQKSMSCGNQGASRGTGTG